MVEDVGPSLQMLIRRPILEWYSNPFPKKVVISCGSLPEEGGCDSYN